MKLLDYVKDHLVYMDGGMGTLLQARGLQPGELPERWNVSHPDVIVDLQKTYYEAGANILVTNTFGANLLKYDEEELRSIVQAAVANAKRAREVSEGTHEKFIALDIGPLGQLLKPFGYLEFEDAVQIFAKTIQIGAPLGVDLIYIETMNDSYETKAALLAAKENSDLPVFVSNAYSENSKLLTGATPATMVAMLEGMGADVIGANCSLGPKQLKQVVDGYLEYASVPVMLKPNAGLPRSENGQTVYDVFPEEFAEDMREYVKAGVRIIGGCCGTTPAYIKRMVELTKDLQPKPLTYKTHTLISSYNHVVEFKDVPVLIGERVNPTGKKLIKEALRKKDIGYILDEGLKQEANGAHVLDINVGLPDIDEVEMLKSVCYEMQAVCDLPLQIDTTNIEAMEAALREYNGKAMINSVNGKEEVMNQIFPLAKKYGGLIVCLTIDEDGIPDNAEKRVEIAKKIIAKAKEYGIDQKNLIFDTLAMTISADNKAALATLKALRTIRHELGCHTMLGVSNISFGLPHREVITSTFFTMAMENGLSAAIMNPGNADMMRSYYAFKALSGLDESCTDYIAHIEDYAYRQSTDQKQVVKEEHTEYASELQRLIIKGLKDQAGTVTEQMLATANPLDIVNEHIIPALDIVGQGFENKTLYLPQLLMSAEASQSAFAKIKQKMERDATETESKGKFVIATVHGDVHDIGKNIVKLLLENYGFEVFDLGKDVPPEVIVDKVIEEHAPLVGLSALMTTTVPAMEETIKQLREKAPWAKVIVGGAVLTQSYADKIGADCYGKDAMATVRYALSITEQK